MPDLKSLNEEQRLAVTSGSGPLLIIAGAGTGKTTVVTKRIEHLILDKKIPASNILALTFTEKAAQEMETRIDEILPYGYTTLWIETFHAFCDRILKQEAINIGLNPRFDLLTEAESLLFLRKHLFEFNLDYFRPLGNPVKFLQGMLTHFSRLRDDDISPKQYLAYAEKLDGNKPSGKLPDGKNKKNADSGVGNDEVKKILELAHAFKVYEDLKAKNGVMDYSDLISNTLKLFRERPAILKQYQKQFQYVFVDEFQDTNYAQNEMAILLAGDRQNITVVGDDDQCLPGNALISTPQGTKKIEAIKINDSVLTGVGKGHLGVSLVKNVFKNKKQTSFITVKTKTGAKLTTTANHKMFCYVPKKVTSKHHYYVYLMYRKNLGWRLGITNDLSVRLKLERSSDAIIGLRAFQTEQEARYHELLWSLQYRIPTCIFKEREGVMLQGEYVQKLYRQFDTEKNALQLAENLGINLQNYHYILDAVTRGQSKRIVIHFYQCYRNYTAKKIYKNSILQNPLISHLVQLETSNEEIIKKIKSHSISYVKAKKGIRVRFASNDMDKAYAFAEKLKNITGGFIEMKSVIGTLNQVNMPSLIMPAGNLLEGLSVPVVKDNHVYYDEIISVKRELRDETVYDLEIDKTHNFIANGIVVHNSIYRWRGAAISNMMQFRTHFPKAKIVALTKNYRSTQHILDGAYELIQNNNPDRLEIKEKIDKKLYAMREMKGKEISFHYANRGEEEAEMVVKKIQEEMALVSGEKKLNYNDFAILVRANDHSTPFLRALERARIPYQFLGPGHLFQQSEIKDLIAYFHVLANFDDMSSLYRIITMPIFALQARDVASILNFAKKSNLSLFEAMEQVENSSVTEEGKEKITRITEMIKRHLEKVPKEEAGQILYYFFEDSGLLGYYLDPGTAKTEKEAQNIAKFFEKLQSFASNHTDASVFAVADWLDLSMELGESPQAAEIDWSKNNAVNILTVHSSKGLEFPVVFVVNLVSQRFPSRDRKEQIPVPIDLIKETLPEGEEGLQEERRLFYVASTRAKDKLYLSAARFYNEGKRERKISPFVIETLGEQTVHAIVKKQTEEPPGQQLSLLEVLNSNIERQEVKIEEPVQTTEITFISYSQLQTFQTCPLHYKLKYILNLPSPPSPALSYGNSVHSTLRDFFLLLKQKNPVKESVIKELLQKNWINQGYTSKTHEQQTYTQAEALLVDFAKVTIQNPPDTIAVEQPFNFWLDKLKVGGRIDRIDKNADGKIEIIDYKTGRNVPTEKKAREDLQLSMYALAADEVKDGILGHDPKDVLLTLNYVEEKKIITTTRTREDLEQAKEEIREIVRQIQTSDFSCSHSILCKTCEYQMLCQADRS